MRRVSLAVCLSVAFFGCGSNIIMNDVSGPVAACDSFSYAACNRLSQCQSGVNVSSCTQLLTAAVMCTSASCGTDTYSPTGAQTCLDAYNNQDCADAVANVTPPECAITNYCLAP
ncbi:MAG: hypothetical protein ACLQDQ_15350 [Myxococcaceae bacterium]